MADATTLSSAHAPVICGIGGDHFCGTCLSIRDWKDEGSHDVLEHLVRARLEDALRDRGLQISDPRTIPIGVSARHIHLSPGHVAALFGLPRLEPMRWLLQPGEFATANT